MKWAVDKKKLHKSKNKTRDAQKVSFIYNNFYISFTFAVIIFAYTCIYYIFCTAFYYIFVVEIALMVNATSWVCKLYI